MPTPPLILDIYRFLRFSAMGASAVLPLLGAASAGGRPTPRTALRLIGAACAFHAFAYVDNDVCDLPLDRTQPLRAAYPLVRGAITPQAARVIAWGCAGLALLGSLRSEGRSKGALHAPAAALALMAAYNRWGKRCPAPPLTDALQGLSWALLIYGGALGAGRAPARLTHLLAAYELLLIMLVNGVHGALRDLENDAAHGARTTALWLMGAGGQGDRGTGGQGNRGGGGREHERLLHSAFCILHSNRLLAYALALQAGMLALAGYAAAANPAGLPPAQRGQAALGVGLTGAATLALLARAARGGVAPADMGMLHLILILSTPVALVAPGMDPAPRAALLLAHTLPLLANGMTYDALRWLTSGDLALC